MRRRALPGSPPLRAIPRSWLLVYLAEPAKPGERWLDKGNDPEMRAWPMTWGICRTDTRIDARVGDDLFFVACGADRPMSDRYYLAAQFHVAEKISWPEAVERFAKHPNVIIEPLPPGPDLAERIVTYVADHRDELEPLLLQGGMNARARQFAGNGARARLRVVRDPARRSEPTKAILKDGPGEGCGGDGVVGL